MMPVRNEAERYLDEVLADLSTYVDQIVILDDASTDATPDICRSYPKVILHRNETPQFFVDESALRAQLWEYTVAAQPDWVLAIDADEIFEERMQHEIAGLIDQNEFDAVEFRLFDFWGCRTHYRIDGGWNPWPKRVRMLFRYQPGKSYTWPQQRLHCGRIPLEARQEVRVYQSDLRVKHLGWANPDDIQRKYRRYREYYDDPHLQSVLVSTESIQLERWIEGKVLPF